MKPFRDGEERQSGTIRTAPARIRSRGDDQEPCKEAWHSPADGAPGDLQRDSARPEKGRAGTTKAGAAEGAHRADAGSRPSSTTQTAAHGTPDLDQVMRGASRTTRGGADRASLRRHPTARTGTEGPGRVCAAEL